MTDAISQLHPSAETAGIDDWRRHIQRAIESAETRDEVFSHFLNEKQLFRDPLKACKFRTLDIVAVYGYTLGERAATLVYYWDEDLHSIKWNKGDIFSRRRVSKPLLELGWILTKICDKNPSAKKIVAATVDENFVHIESMRTLLKGVEVHWRTLGDLKFACLFREKSVSKDVTSVQHQSSIATYECLAFHSDYFHYRSPIWRAVPMRYLCEQAGSSENDLCRIHLHPKTFYPSKETDFQHDARGDQKKFLWPWQKCIRRIEKTNDFGYEPIPTTSLVFDLRKSTIAMEQLPPSELGKYSPFINHIVEDAIEIIFEFGGFFDKETGDGVVAHFIDFDDLICEDQIQACNRRAFDAAISLIRKTAKTCSEFQQNLNFGIESLGGSVGLHAGAAVWISELNQIRAIGQSVVFAARLANEATTNGVFVSNSYFESIQGQVDRNVLNKFETHAYQGKEYRGSPGLYGHQVVINDDF